MGWHNDTPPAGWAELVPVGPYVMLGRIPANDAEEFVAACLPHTSTFVPKSQAPVRYTFVRRDAPKLGALAIWDPDEAIHTAIMFSRLVRANCHCTDGAVRTVDGWDSGGRQVIPLDPPSRYYAIGLAG